MKRILLKLPPYTYSIIVVLAVLYLTLFPEPLPDNDIQLFPYADKVIHAIMMMGVVLALSFDYIRREQQLKLSLSILITFFIVTSLFGGIIELLQDYMNLGRSKDILDFIFNIIGAIIGVIISKFWLRKIINKLFL